MTTPSTYAHFKFNDDAANTVVTDDGSGANNGVASTNTANMSAVGKINDCFDFDNTNTEYINIDALMADIINDTTGSICFWINPDTDDVTGDIFGLWDTSGNQDYFFIRRGTDEKILVSVVTGDTTYWQALSSVTITADSGWHHVALVQDGDVPVLYIDGEDVTTLPVTTNDGFWFTHLSNIDNGRIGCRDYNGAGQDLFFNGQLDDFRYYQDTALTAQDIRNIYRAGTGTEDDPPADYSPGRNQGIIIA